MPATSNASDPITVAAIIDGIRSYEAHLFQDTDEFQICVTSRVTDITPTKGRVRPIKWELARKKDSWYTWACVLSAPESSAEIQIAEKGKLFEWTQDQKSCFVRNFDNGYNIFRNWGYFQRLGLNIYRYIAKTNGADYQKVAMMSGNTGEAAVLARPMLPYFLEANATRYTVHAGMEKVDGRGRGLVRLMNELPLSSLLEEKLKTCPKHRPKNNFLGLVGSWVDDIVPVR